MNSRDELVEALEKMSGILSLNDPTDFIAHNQAYCNNIAKMASTAIANANKE